MHDMSHDNHQHEHQPHDHAAADGNAGDLAICPVMQIAVNKEEAEANGLKRVVRTQEYYLCCSTCAQQFDAWPEKYAE